MADKDFKVKSGLDLGTPLPLTEGGTGQTSASNALNALLPLQTGNTGKVLTTNGSTTSWEVVGLPAQTGNSGKYLTTDGTSASWAPVSASAPIILGLMGAY